MKRTFTMKHPEAFIASESLQHGKNCPCHFQSSKTRTQILLPHLKKIFRLKKTDRSSELEKAPVCLIKYISDCSGALLKNHIQLPSGKYKKFRRHKDALHLLAKKNSSLKEKRQKIVQQNGAGFMFLIPLLSAAAQGLIQALT